RGKNERTFYRMPAKNLKRMIIGELDVNKSKIRFGIFSQPTDRILYTSQFCSDPNGRIQSIQHRYQFGPGRKFVFNNQDIHGQWVKGISGMDTTNLSSSRKE